MKIVQFLACVMFLTVAGNAFAEKVIVSCDDCSYSDISAKALTIGNDMSGMHVFLNVVVFDTVNNDIFTFHYQRSFEPEVNQTFRDFSEVNTTSDDIQAFQLYMDLRNLSEYEIVFNPDIGNSVDVYATSSINAGGVSVSKSQLFNMSSGTVVTTDFPSVQWLNSDRVNRNQEVAVFLRSHFQITGLNALSFGIKNALQTMLFNNPLQYSVVFANGDTITFNMVTPWSSIPFQAQWETAMDKDNNPIDLGNNSSRVGYEHDASYSSVFHQSEYFALDLRTVCISVRTGPSGRTSSSRVCYQVLL